MTGHKLRRRLEALEVRAAGLKPTGEALRGALPAHLRADPQALEEAAQNAPSTLAGSLPALALWAFLTLPEEGQS